MIEAILVAVVISLCIYKILSRPKGLPPGPFQLPVLGYLPFMGTKPVYTLEKLANRFGKVFMMNFGPYRILVINELDAVKQAFKEEVFSGRPNLELFKLRSLGGMNGIIFSEGSHWREQRRFTLRHLRDFGFGRKTMESLIADEMIELTTSFRKDQGQPMNLTNKFNIAILNALWHIATGERFSHDDPALKSLMQTINRNIRNIDIASDPGLFFPLLKYISKKFDKTSMVMKMTTELNDMFKDRIRRHKEELDEDHPRDFMDVYLKEINGTTDADSSFYKNVGETHFAVTLLDLFIAGSETTSTTLQWAFLHMIRNPEVQRKVQEELDSVVGRDRLPTLEDKPELPYLEATITEIQRFVPIVPYSVPHATLADTEFLGYKIPKGTLVLANLFHIQRDPGYWQDPLTFRPERFLTADGKLVKDERVVPFSVGKRSCLGETLARAELFIFFSGLMSQFTFSAESGVSPRDDFGSGSVLAPLPYNVIVKARY